MMVTVCLYFNHNYLIICVSHIGGGEKGMFHPLRWPVHLSPLSTANKTKWKWPITKMRFQGIFIVFCCGHLHAGHFLPLINTSRILAY